MSHAFDIGGKYPRDADMDRLSKYEYYKLLFNGDHYPAFIYSKFIDVVRDERGIKVPRYKRDDYLTYNMMSLVSKVSADLLFGEDISLQHEDQVVQDWLDDWAEHNHLWQSLYQAGLTSTYMGDVAYRVDRIDNKGHVSFMPPNFFFPSINMDNIHGDLSYASLAWMRKDEREDYWLRTEEYYPGVIYNRLFKLEEADSKPTTTNVGPFVKQWRIVKELPIQEVFPDVAPEVKTEIDEINVGFVPNFRDLTQFYGRSDIADVDSLQAEINNRLTANRVVLNRHSIPKLGVPKGFIDRHGVLRNTEVYEFDEAGKEAKYVTWDGKLENSFLQISEVVQEILSATETAPALLDLDKQGGVESGRALRYKMLRTMSKIKRKQQFWDKAVRDMIRISRKLEGLPDIQPRINWPDGLPSDDIDLATSVKLASDAGAISTEEKVRRLNPEWSDDQVNEEVARINQDSTPPQITTHLPTVDMTPPMAPEGQMNG